MDIYEIVLVRRLSGGVSSISIFLDVETKDAFLELLEKHLGSISMRQPHMYVKDIFGTGRYFQASSWEQINVYKLKGERLKSVLAECRAFHAISSPDGKVIDISRAKNE